MKILFLLLFSSSILANTELATFAGGCFWCMEAPFEKMDGVLTVVSGYSGGKITNPTYEQVSTGETGHVEAVRIEYDGKKVSFEQLLEVFIQQIDPRDGEGQFADRGSQYRPVIFYHDNQQKKIAAEFLKELNKIKSLNEKIRVQLLPIESFYPAEAYHQDFYKKNKNYYERYSKGSGRKDFISTFWKNNKVPNSCQNNSSKKKQCRR